MIKNSKTVFSTSVAFVFFAIAISCVNSGTGQGQYPKGANPLESYLDNDVKTTELGDLSQWTGLYDIQEGDEDWISNLSLKIHQAPSELRAQFALKHLLVASGVIEDFNTGERVVFSGSIVVPTEEGGGYFSLGPFKVLFGLASDGTRVLRCGDHIYRRQR